LEDVYRNPGPLQFEGPGVDSNPISLCVEDQDYMGRIKKLQEYLEKAKLILVRSISIMHLNPLCIVNSYIEVRQKSHLFILV